MNAPKRPAAPESGDFETIPTFEELAADPEIAALLDFEPVPRKRKADAAWTPELQREFIARLAMCGSQGRACEHMGKDLTGMMKIYRSPLAASFRASWHGAIELAERRRAEQAAAVPGDAARARAPTIDHRRKARFLASAAGPFPGQALNEYGKWEDEDSLARRAEEARGSIARKLLNARRLYLQEISGSAGKRAAFEILTELPIDWEKAEKGEPQDDEPWRQINQREPDMILTAESGWSFGEAGYGPDKKAELRAAIDQFRAEEGLGPVDWDAEE